MTEYITKEQALETQCEKCPMYNCILRCNPYNAVKNLPPANVVEHSKIDKAIEEIEKIDLIVHDGINHYYKDGEEVIAEVLEILKRNIGE